MSTGFLLRGGLRVTPDDDVDGTPGGGEMRSAGGGDVCVRGRYCVAGFGGFVGEEGVGTPLDSGFCAGDFVV